METLRQDFLLALRLLSKKPGFTSVAVLTLALGIAINATMFSLVSAFLLRRPPGIQPDRVAVVSAINPAPSFLSDANALSAPNFLAWRAANSVFSDMAASNEFRTASISPQGSSGAQSQPESVPAAAVTSNYFPLLGVSPLLGRAFSQEETTPGRDRVAILSHDLWQRDFASDPSIVGRSVRINRQDVTIVGVLPDSFRLLGFTPQLWTPLVLTAADESPSARNDRSLYVLGRLKPGVTPEQARAEMATLAGRAQTAFPDSEKGWGVTVRTLPEFLIYNFGIRTGLMVIMTTVAFVLLIACANVAGLLLARAAGRRRELAIRIALGAGRLRIVRQLLTEGLVIASFGGALGLLLSYWGIKVLRANMNFNEAVSAVPLGLDWRVVVFAFVVSLLCAALCGIMPALNASRTDVNLNLKDQGRAVSSSLSQSRLRTVMVTAEIALALFLLIGTGLLIRGIYLIEHQNLGFQPDHLLTANLTLDPARYKDSAQQALFVRDVLPLLQRIPGARDVAVTSDLPAAGAGSVTLLIQGQPELPANQRLTARDLVVSVDYFRTAGIPLLRGRSFTPMDTASSPRIVLINEEFAHRHLKDRDPLGQRIRLDVPGASPQWSEIVGIIANVKTYSEETRDDPQVYEPILQRPVSSLAIMVRTTSDPSALASDMRGAVAQVDSELPLSHVLSMPAVIDNQKAGNPFFAGILGIFAVLALILAAIGIYGLIAYSVSQRTREIGIRMAIGASNSDVQRMILWHGLKMAAIGGAVGLLLALPLPKLFDAIFYGLKVGEPRLYVIVPAAILAVAMLATYIPARRATRVDPISALHQE